MGDWAKLAEAVRRARKRHGWSQPQLARRAGLGATTVKRLENGRESVGDRSLVAIEAALGWQYGSAQDVLDGGRPTPEVDPDMRAIIELWPRIPLRGRAAIRMMAEQWAD